MIQIRNVSDETHRILKARAASAGMSLSDFLKRDLEKIARRATLEEIDERLRRLGPSKMTTQAILDALDEVRRD